MPSPVEERPGLLIRDPFRYSEIVMIVPGPLVPCLEFFDGQQTDLDLLAALVEITGDLQVGEVVRSLVDALSDAGFLENETFAQLKEERHRAFAESENREAAHAGSAYPAEAEPLRETIERYMGGEGAPSPDGVFAIAAPHVSPEGGWESYQAAYRPLGPQYKDRTFVILGTSHYGEPERFGLTRKPYVTPLGAARVDLPLLDELAAKAAPSIGMEDYCHAVEHSIEFQVVFLQHMFGPDIRILPILCGSFARSIYFGGKPEDDDKVRRFLDVLGEIAARDRQRLFFVLGIDMAHMGRRYGDDFEAQAGSGRMQETEARDRARIERIAAGDADGFWSLVQHNRDDLKWCGSSPLYTFLRAARPARAELLRYQQWNIDPESVVSFAGMSFGG